MQRQFNNREIERNEEEIEEEPNEEEIEEESIYDTIDYDTIEMMPLNSGVHDETVRIFRRPSKVGASSSLIVPH